MLRDSKAFPGVVPDGVEFDSARSKLYVTVGPGFDRHHELVAAIQRVAQPIEMFRATLERPRQVFLYLEGFPSLTDTERVARAIRPVPGVRSVYPDERGVVAVAIDQETANRREILRRAREAGYRAEIVETRFRENMDSRFSELSHHAVGVLVIFLGFILILEKARVPAGRLLGYAAPVVWIVGGIWVIVLGDPDAWPYQRTLEDSLSDKMILQHKILGAAMTVLGVAEWMRRRGRGWRHAPTVLFLIIAAASGIMLQFHFQDRVDPTHVQAWRTVNTHHLITAVLGAAVLVARALDEFGIVRRGAFTYVWPVLLTAVGAMLAIYWEPVW